jgi:chromosomal replication initiator protein
MVTTEHIWLRVSKRLQTRLSPDEFRTWFSQASLKKLEGDLATVAVPNRFYASWISEKYLPPLEESLAHVLRTSPKVSFSYESFLPHREEEGAGRTTGLSPAMTFAEIHTGEWNHFALSSALKVSETGSAGYNPLYLFSKPGLGKTHLLHAIGNRILAESPGASVKYVDCPTFVSECSRRLKNDQHLTFQELHSGLDALLFDNVHLLSTLLKIQKELVQIFDLICSEEGKIVFAADRPPQEIEGMSDLLGSRLGSGVIAEIRRPDPNAFLKIAKDKARECGVALPDEVISILPQASRDLHGLTKNVHKLKNYSSLKEGKIDLSVAMSLIKGPDSPLLGIEDIKTIASGYFNIRIQDLTSGGKKRSLSYPRQVAMYLARKYTNLSFKEIGTSFGHKDHSTVIHAIRKIEAQRGKGKAIADDLTRMESLLS